MHSTPVAKIKVYLGNDQLPPASPGASFTGALMQLLESPTVHHAAVDDHSHSKKRKVSFVGPSSDPLEGNVEKPKTKKRPRTSSNPGPNQSLNTPTKPILSEFCKVDYYPVLMCFPDEDETQVEETKTSASPKGLYSFLYFSSYPINRLIVITKKKL